MAALAQRLHSLRHGKLRNEARSMDEESRSGHTTIRFLDNSDSMMMYARYFKQDMMPIDGDDGCL